MSAALFFSELALICYAVLLVLVFRRGLRLRVNQLFALYLASMAIWQLAYIIVCLSHTADMALLGYRLSTAAVTAQFILFCFFARALLRIRARPALILLGILIWAGVTLAALTDEAHFLIDVRRNAATGLFVPEYGPLIVLVTVSTVGFLGFGIASLVRGFRQATSSMERNRLRYVLIAILIIFAGALANLVPSLIGHPIDVIANIISASLFSYAILRYQLLDVTLVVRRGLAYSILTITIATVYLLSVLLFERLMRAAVGFGAYLVPVALAMVAAVLLQPWRDKTQAWVDRLLFREQYDSRHMLQELSRQAATIIDLDTLGNLLLNQICGRMHMERAALLFDERGGEGFTVAAQRGLDEGGAGLRLGRDHPVVQRLQHTERLLRASEMDTLPQFRSLWDQEREELAHLGAQLFVPLQVKEELVGILAVGPKLSGEAHSPDDEMTLSTLANQTAVAVENAILLATTRAQVAELTALQEIGVRLVSSRDLPTVLQVVAESGARLLRADEAHVALYDESRERFATHHGLIAGGQHTVLSWDSATAIPLRTVTRTRKPIAIGDLWLYAAIPPALARAGQVRAVAAQPLRRGEAVIAVLAVAYHQPHTFTEDEMRLLGMLADQATLAIDNAQLLESEHAKRQLADTLSRVSRVIGSTLELDTLLNLVLEQLENVVHYDDASIILLSGEGVELSTVRGFGATKQSGGTITSAQQEILLGLARERKPLIVRDVLQDERWVDVPQSVTARAIIAVPLLARGQPQGLLIMARSQPDCYTEDDLQNAVAFANHAALAIENARLYQETIAEKTKTDTILRETLSGIVVTDVDLRIVTYNSGAEAITGYSAEQVIGKRLPDVLGPDIAAPTSPLGQVMARGQRVPPQERVIQMASGLRDILQGTVALHDADHRLFGYLISFADITRLKEVDRLKTDIVANVSHELRTPLSSIKAYTELLLDHVEGDDHRMRDQFLRTIDLETDRLSQLISDLLDLSRFEAGRFEVRKVPLDLREMLPGILELLEVQRRSREVSIQSEVAEGLPNIMADRDMVTIIIRNLVANAIKFSRQGGEVLVALDGSPEHLVVRVTDYGIGIPVEAMPHLFQKFYRVQAAAMSIEGTGLGLVLTKQAVEAHGGSIEVRSEEGVGTTFTVCLPWR
jgi:PAS domain S-box-containing protein